MSYSRTLSVPLLVLQAVFCSTHLLPSPANLQGPALYELDDWAECDIGPDRDTYCLVRVIVTGTLVQNASSLFAVDDLRHFRRSLLDRGICLASQASANGSPRLKLPATWNKKDRYIMDRELFPPSMRPDARMELVAGEVINRRLQASYPGLSAYTEIEYCLKNDPTGQFELAKSVLLSVAVVLGCTLVLRGRGWIVKEFIAPPTDLSLAGKKFLLFDMYKSYSLVGVVLSHCFLFGPFLMPLKNIEQLEQSLAHPNALFFRLLCPFLMLVFFTMSSMLLTVKLLHDRSQTPSRGTTFTAIVANRLIRLQPLNILTIGFCALAYDRFIQGPLGPRQLIVEQGLCRSRWWMNVLFISNFNTYKPCLPHSWYISADFQLFVLITAVLIAVHRWPHITKVLVGGMVAVAFLGPFLTVIWTNFDPTGPVNLHEMRFFLMDNDFMAQLYTPFYNNLCWSVAGMLAGFVYDRYQRTEVDSVARKKMLDNIGLSIAIAFAMFILCLLGTIAASDEDSTRGNRWWLAFWYSTYRMAAAALFGAIILRVLLTERDFYGSSLTRMGAKLYYCVYLIHMPIFRIVFSNETAVTEFSLHQLFRMSMTVFGISYALAIVLHYTYEKPVMRILRRFLLKRV